MEFIFTLLVIIFSLILLLILLAFKREKITLRGAVVIKRFLTITDDFEIWTDLTKTTIKEIPGVIRVSYEAPFWVVTDPRIGREEVIEAILDIVERQES